MPRYTNKVIEDALRASGGMIYVAAKQLGCSGNTIKARLKNSPALQMVVSEETELIIDRAEQKLARAIDDGDLGAIKFLLSTKGKRRGYVQRMEIEDSPIDWESVPEETRDAFIDNRITLDDVRRVIRARAGASSRT